MKYFYLLVLIFCSFQSTCQVGIGTNNPDASAVLELSSSTKGFLPTRMTALQRNAISSPAQGLVIYCTDCGTNGELQVYNGVEYTTATGGDRTRTPRSAMGNDLDGESIMDYYGVSTSLSSDGTKIAIGGYLNDGAGNDAGHVRVFEYISGSWTQMGSDIEGEAAGDWFGYSVSLSSNGTKLLVGAPKNDGNGTDAGHARVYEFSNGNWIQLGNDIDGEAANDLSGFSSDISDDGLTIAIGAENNDGNGTDAGHIRVYTYSNNSWIQQGSDIEGEAVGDLFGYFVSLSSDGSIVAIGAPDNDGSGTDAGHIRVYKLTTGNWVQLGLDIDGENAGDSFGSSLSLSSSGMALAAGAPDNDGNGSDAGHVRVFQYNSGTWTQLGSDIDGETSGDRSGYFISLSAGGTIVAIGALNNDGNGSNSGHVRVYEYISATWTQLGADINGEASGDQSGYSVSLSSDGSIVAIGAPINDGNNGSESGHVRVFNNLTTTGL